MVVQIWPLACCSLSTRSKLIQDHPERLLALALARRAPQSSPGFHIDPQIRRHPNDLRGRPDPFARRVNVAPAVRARTVASRSLVRVAPGSHGTSFAWPWSASHEKHCSEAHALPES